jgi:hypothetical protein
MIVATKTARMAVEQEGDRREVERVGRSRPSVFGITPQKISEILHSEEEQFGIRKAVES